MGVLVRVALRVVLVMVHLLAAVVDVGAILVAMVPGDVGTVVNSLDTVCYPLDT